ncbi:bifunctional folylpolyglutamate synthase/dihydrofolate synthase [Lapidilactobacillus wuchangensis]|uniref:bifunctional folylpolyglutamate synthase/dihydrofolate synthase n=1 Tax=Lapidilactobacillus wuchangensis TaxID=2486001 RepID=UPI000F7AB472|nr:folylpolyglutamate synthase/dihydrofolate synthase family protein [Lapidilactobacillus wuchangensis]
MIKTAAEAIAYIHQRPRLHRSNKLDTMHQALALFDNPQNKFPTIHVTGTNGKGTASHLISRLLEVHGYRVGLFTSPFILRFNERIQIDHQQIPDADLLKWTQQISATLAEARLTLTEFEFVTVLMFCYFAEQKIDVGVIEVGIGGAHDRTNVIKAEIGVITSIGLDHQELIGPTLADIAQEKAGIIKPGQTVFLGKIDTELQPIIKQKVQQNQAHLVQLDQDLQITQLQRHQGQAHFNWQWSTATPAIKLTGLKLPVWGDWQLWDASLALGAAAQFLRNRQSQLDPALVKQVLANFTVPGRLEVLSQEPLLMLDGAHNVPAMTNLIANIQRNFRGQPVHLILGMMADKDINAVAKLLAKTNWQVTWTTVANNPRAASQAELAEQIGQPFSYHASWQAALQEFLQNDGGEGLYLFAGSFYLISEVRQFLIAPED